MELKDFEQSTGTLRFPVDVPLSEKLVRKLLLVRKKELMDKKNKK